MGEPRVVFMCFYPAYPPTNGSGSVTYGCARHLNAESFIVQVGPAAAPQITPDGVSVETITLEAGTRWKKVLGLRRRVRRMAAACARVSPDMIMLEGASWTFYHWRLLKALRRACPGVPVVYHSHFVEYPWRKEHSGWLAARVTKHAEGHLVRDADHVFAVSEPDARSFDDLYGVKPPLLPNAADVERFQNVPRSQVDDVARKYGLRGRTVLFMGLADYKPNREGIDFLVNEVFEQVRDQCSDAQLVVIGGKVDHRREWLRNPGLIPYEETPAMVHAADVCVAPVFSGTGTRLKILEYMASSRPVVSTVKGAEGLDLTTEEDVLLANDAAGFAAAIVRILDDQELAVRVARSGADLVGRRYSWSALLDGLPATIGHGGAVQ